MGTTQPKNMTKRGSTWYWRETVNGTRHLESLQTADLTVARPRMKVKQDAARAGEYGKLYGTRSKNVFPTIKTITDLYMAEVRRRGHPAVKTAMNNCGRLRMILDVTGIPNADDVSSDVLTVERLKEYADKLLEQNNSPSTQRTAASSIRQARSLFSRRMIEIYDDLTLPPSINRFCTAYIISEPKHQYELPAPQLIETTIKAGRDLKESNPQLYIAFLLCYDLGLRAEEAAQCRPNWFREDDRGIHWLGIISRAEEGYTPKTPRSIPVPASVYADLMKLASEESILSGSLTARRNLIKRDLSAWMRGLGWTRIKKAHELRKLRGSFWRSRYGLDRAHEWLGHSQYQTTLNYYARLPNEPEPLAVDDDLEALRKR